MAAPLPKFNPAGFSPQAQIPAPRFDRATLLGLIVGFTLITAAILMDGSLVDFFDIPSILIVFGGTFAATTMCFSLAEMSLAKKALFRTLFRSELNPHQAAINMIKIAEDVRGKGILYFEKLVQRHAAQPVLCRGFRLLSDMMAPADIERILEQECAAIESSAVQCAQVLMKASEYAPAMGLIGTLVGLVHMLGHLTDPASIGPAMAVAILTTFYGAILANMVFSPLASKLLRNAGEESLVNKLYAVGLMSISHLENPRSLEVQLNSILPPEKRITYYKA